MIRQFIDRFIVHIRDSRLHIPVGPLEDPTYWRYFVIPRNRFLNIYLHCFRHSDAENLHDHRMANLSILLQGSYFEERFIHKPIDGFPLPPTRQKRVKRFMGRLPSTPHRVVLQRDSFDREVSVWSLFIGGPHVRDWGFWVGEKYQTPPPWGGFSRKEILEARWVSHSEVVTVDDPTGVGYGQNR